MKLTMTETVSATLATLLVGYAPAVLSDGGFGDWQEAVPVQAVNSTGGGGCPIETEDGLSLLFASGRGGGVGGLDIWVTDRASIGSAWGVPGNVGAPVNSVAADFCPTPALGRSLFFVSDRDEPGVEECGGGDIYLARQSPSGDWSDPELLGCAPDGPNFAAGERSPSLVHTRFGTYLFYSSAGDGVDSDIYVSRQGSDGAFGPGHKVWGVNSAAADIMPNVRVGPNGWLEMVFSSDRMTWGKQNQPAFGGQDVYTSVAVLPGGPWSEPRNLGSAINTAVNEQRATLSGDGTRMYFGRPNGEVLVSERSKD